MLESGIFLENNEYTHLFKQFCISSNIYIFLILCNILSGECMG